MFKYLKHPGHPVSVNEVLSRGVTDGWDPGFTKKMATWADKVASGGLVTVKYPGYFSEDIKSQLHALLRCWISIRTQEKVPENPVLLVSEENTYRKKNKRCSRHLDTIQAFFIRDKNIQFWLDRYVINRH